MKTLSMANKLSIAVIICVLIAAVYINNTPLNYAISLLMVFGILLLSITRVMSYKQNTNRRINHLINSRLTLAIVIVLCAIISLYLISVSSEPIFSESPAFEEQLSAANLYALEQKFLLHK
ncbi:MAG: hypothetical protein ACPGSC_06540 [Granulosicoccaceae bacterium]